VNNRYSRPGTRPFTQNWWGAHRPVGGLRPWHPWCRPGWRDRPYYWWRPATAVALTGWIAYAWPEPVYYTYGDGGNVYYQDNSVYIDGKEACTAEVYYQQAEAIADDVPQLTEQQADEVEWLPLGVFALTHDGVNDSNYLLQLAVSKEGVIAGTLINEETESVRSVEGKVDKETQRAAWKFVDDKNADVVMETGIYSLTKDECTALVHFGPDKTQEIVMVRMDQPEEGDAEAGESAER
jgi:uncharacterized cysteine cluster protein YcgN (CxxCxxCC family)